MFLGAGGRNVPAYARGAGTGPAVRYIYTLYRYNNFPRFSIEVFGRFVFYIKSTVLVVSTKGYHLLLAYESLGLFVAIN